MPAPLRLSSIAVRLAAIALLAVPLTMPPAAEAAPGDKPAATKAKQGAKKKKTTKRKHASKKAKTAKAKPAKARNAHAEGSGAPIAATAPRTAESTGPMRLAAAQPEAGPAAKVVCQHEGKVYLLADCSQLPAALAAAAR